jgi:ubiquinone/menaquinone biosynthesis C-methylase UbiE
METHTRFNDYVELYDKYRLKYNSDVINKIIEFITSSGNNIETIADIGAGTGILTRQLLKYNFKTFSLEPNEFMRNKSIKKDTKSKITHINGTSIKTTLKTSSIDIIFVGTAIHWFEPKKTLKEFKRILKKNGFLVLLRMGDTGQIGEDLHNLNKKYRTDNNNKVLTRYNKDMKNYSNEFHTILSRKPVNFTIEQFIGLQLSMSTAPKKDDEIYDSYIKELSDIYKKNSKKNKLTTINRTTALISNKLI